MDWGLVFLFWKHSARILCILICTWAMLRGGIAERIAAVIIAVGWYLSYLNATHDGSGPAMATVIIDVVVTVALIVLAVWSRRPWTFFIAACMVNAVATHFMARALDLGIFSSMTVSGFWGAYAILACLAFGVMDHRARIRQGEPA